jgi:NADH-quinone oxidoreductase subunit J
MFEVVAFYLFAFLTIAMFSITIFTKNVLYALSSLAAGMIFISAFFFLLDADFLGVVQIIVYTGAVMALYAFGMMFFDSLSDIEEKIANPKLAFGLTGFVALLIVIIFIAPLIGANAHAFYPTHPEIGNIQDVGIVLFTKYLVPFEVAAIMLLVAMIGGIILAGKKMDISITQLSEQEVDKHHTNIEIKKDIK